MNDYVIADLRIRIEADGSDLAALGLDGFKPFGREADATAVPDCVMQLDRRIDEAGLHVEKVLSTFDFSEAQADCSFSATDTGYMFRIVRRAQPERPIIFHKAFGENLIIGNALCNKDVDLSLLRFGIWIMAGIVFVEHDAIAIHSSTIVYDGKAVLFLGESGTGKSTHTRLWRENIEGARLLNDDSPIIRHTAGSCAAAYGSPWSGKTPCYIDKHFPIRAICRLSQAPHNRIRRLSAIEAIGALLPSCPPAFAHDTALQDAICATLSRIIKSVPVYHLECLPDADAARLSFNTIFAE